MAEFLNPFTRALVSYNLEHGRMPVTMGIGRFEGIKFDPTKQEAIEFQRMHGVDDQRTRERNQALDSALEIR